MLTNASPGVFTIGHLFQRGDLPLLVKDNTGNPYSPYSVTYALYYKPKDAQCLTRVGPSGRVPVKADLGEYYATGYAGECGQPGQWYIRWTLQEQFEGPLTEEEFGFVVFSPSDYCTGNSTSTARNCCGCTPRSW